MREQGEGWKEEGVEGVEGVEQGRGEGGRGRPLPMCSLMTVTKMGKLLLKGGEVRECSQSAAQYNSVR